MPEMSQKYPAPVDSPFINQLLVQAHRDEIPEGTLREILWLITAHTHLTALPTAAERLQMIIECAAKQWPSTLEKASLCNWQPILAWIIDNRITLAKEISGEFAKTLNSTGNNPVRGSGSDEFPFYAMLCEPLRFGDENNNRFVLLSSHLFFAYVVAQREESSLNAYEQQGAILNFHLLPNQVDGAARAVRRFANPDRIHLLENLPLEVAPELFADAYENITLSDLPEIESDRTNLCRFLWKAWGEIEWREGTGGGGGGSGGGHNWVGGGYENTHTVIESVDSAQFPDADPATYTGASSIGKLRAVSARRRKKRLESDLPPDEDDDDELVVLAEFDCEVIRQDPGSLSRAAAGKARHIAKGHQLFQWDYSQLSDREVIDLYCTIRKEAAALSTLKLSNKAQTEDLETLLLLQSILTTGHPLDEIADAVIFRGPQYYDDEPIAFVLEADPSAHVFCAHWRIKALRPPYAAPIIGSPSQTRTTAQFIDLPDMTGMIEYIDLLYKNRVEQGRSNPSQKVKLFRNTAEQLRSNVNRWLRKYSTDQRVTLPKIEQMALGRINALCGDIAIASCTLGIPHRLARVRLHYTSPWNHDLQKLYLRSLQPLLVKANSSLEFLTIKHLPTVPKASVGALLCPTREAVHAAITQLKEEIKRRSHFENLAELVTFHNLLTLYCVQFFAYATSCRAIVTPYQSPEEINRSRGLAAIDDKDDDQKHKSRLVKLPQLLIKQMKGYGKYIARLKKLIVIPGQIQREPCFFLTESGEGILVRPKTLEPLLESYLNVRANTHRRFLRTELLERDCPPEVVDALLGHAHLGEDPTSTFSSFDFGSYTEELETYLFPLLREIGFNELITIPSPRLS